MRFSKALLGTLLLLVSIAKVSLIILLFIASSANYATAATQDSLSHNPQSDGRGHPVTGFITASLSRGFRTAAGVGNEPVKSVREPHITPNPSTVFTSLNNPEALTSIDANSNAASPSVASPNATGNFQGLHTTVDCTVPPDSDGTVGPTYYVAFVNNFNNCATQTPMGNVGFFLKSNGTLTAAFYYPKLFGSFTTNCNDPMQHSDPQVVYDSAEDRYLFVDFTATSPFQMCIATTLSNDPVNGPYCLASYPTLGGSVPDYDKAGVWIDGFYVTYNPSPSDSRTVVFNKSDLEACNSTIRLQDFDMGSDKHENDNFCTPQPNHIFRPVPATFNIFTGGVPSPGEPEFLVATYCLTSHVYVFTLHIDWSNSANSLLTRAIIAVQTTRFAPNTVSSPGNPIDTLNLHLMSPANYVKDASGNEYLWTTMTACNGTSCTASTGTSAIAWYQLKLTSGNAAGTTVKNQNTWKPDSTSRLQAAAAFDRQGNVLMDYTQVSSSQDPAVAYAGRLASDPANTLNQTETILYRGTSMGTGACGSQNPCIRWGDYSANFIDPDGCTFWFTHEYYATSDPWQWDTRIGGVRYPSCTPLTYGRTVGPSSLMFTSLGVSVTTPPKNVTVSNTGTGPLVVQTANITGTNAADFNIQSDSCSTALQGTPAGSTCTIQVTCTPSGPGIRSATLNVRTNLAAADLTPVPLSCAASIPTTTLVACLPTTVAIAHTTVCTATVNDTSTGPTPTGTVSFTSTVTTGSFSPVSCLLNGTGTFANCRVSYVQTSITTPTITASYNPDANHLTSTATTTLTLFLQGDVNGDCKVNVLDLADVGIAFGSTPASPNWNPAADINHDGTVNITDLVLVALNFGLAC